MTNTKPHIQSTPDICGGSPRIAGTRIPVWLIEVQRRHGMTTEDINEYYPHLTAEEIYAAYQYADNHTHEIEKQIKENQA